MIHFLCSGCGREFSVADKFGGRQVRCKDCGTKLTIPECDEEHPQLEDVLAEVLTMEEPSKGKPQEYSIVEESNPEPVRVFPPSPTSRPHKTKPKQVRKAKQEPKSSSNWTQRFALAAFFGVVALIAFNYEDYFNRIATQAEVQANRPSLEELRQEVWSQAERQMYEQAKQLGVHPGVMKSFDLMQQSDNVYIGIATIVWPDFTIQKKVTVTFGKDGGYVWEME